jgi:hypothetical protein
MSEAPPTAETHLSSGTTAPLVPYTPSEPDDAPSPFTLNTLVDDNSSNLPPSPSPGNISLTPLPTTISLPVVPMEILSTNGAEISPPQGNFATPRAIRPLIPSRSEGSIPISGPRFPSFAPPSSVTARLEAAAGRNAIESPNRTPREPIDKYTCTTMPDIHDAHPTAALDFIDIELVTDWEQCPGGKLLAIPFEIEAQDADIHDGIRDKIFTAVTEITQSREIGTSTPKRSKEAIELDYAPTSFLIYNLSDTQYDLLLRRKVWSSSAITFRVIQLNQPCPDFLFCIKGFGIYITEYILNMVRSVWLGDEVLDVVDAISETFPEDTRTQVKSTILEFLNSVRVSLLEVKTVGDILQPHFNVYATGSLISNDDVWLYLRKFLAGCKYGSPTHGVGTTIITPFQCTICHGVDHPKGLCPFPKIPGWNGPGAPPPPTEAVAAGVEELEALAHAGAICAPETYLQ